MTADKGKEALAVEKAHDELMEFFSNLRQQTEDRWAMGQITSKKREQILAWATRELKKEMRRTKRFQRQLETIINAKEASRG